MNETPNMSGLTPWKPGESGNPAGKPTGTRNFTTLVREALKKLAVDKDGKELPESYEALLIKRVLNKAISQGDTRMIEILWNYLDGKPMQKFEHGVDKESLADLTTFFRGAANPTKPQ